MYRLGPGSKRINKGKGGKTYLKTVIFVIRNITKHCGAVNHRNLVNYILLKESSFKIEARRKLRYFDHCLFLSDLADLQPLLYVRLVFSKQTLIKSKIWRG